MKKECTAEKQAQRMEENDRALRHSRSNEEWRLFVPKRSNEIVHVYSEDFLENHGLMNIVYDW